MKAGWKTVKLGDVADITSGLWKGELGELIEAKVYRATNFIGNGELSDDKLVSIPVELKKLTKRTLEPGDILLEKSGGGPNQPVGRVGFFDKSEPLHSFSNFTSRLRVRKGSSLDPKFLHKYLFWTHLRGDTASMQNNSTNIRNLDLDKYREIEIPLPPLAEQKRIVALLDEAFAGIDEAKARVAHLNKYTSSILPAKLNQVFSQPLATGPKLRINDFSQVYDGPHATPKTTDKGPIFLGISSLKDGVIELSETRHVSLQDFKRWTRRVQPQAGDVVFSYETRIGQVAVIPDNLECCLGRRMGLVRLDNQTMMPGFFAFQYLSPPFQKFLQSKTVKGVTVDRISLKEFPSFEIWVPGLSLQKKINQEVQESQTLSLHLSRLLAKKLDHLNELKTSLLRQAFTGALFT